MKNSFACETDSSFDKIKICEAGLIANKVFTFGPNKHPGICNSDLRTSGLNFRHIKGWPSTPGN